MLYLSFGAHAPKAYGSQFLCLCIFSFCVFFIILCIWISVTLISWMLLKPGRWRMQLRHSMPNISNLIVLRQVYNICWSEHSIFACVALQPEVHANWFGHASQHWNRNSRYYCEPAFRFFVLWLWRNLLTSNTVVEHCSVPRIQIYSQ